MEPERAQRVKGISMEGENVLLLQNMQKHQTRRLVKPQPTPTTRPFKTPTTVGTETRWQFPPSWYGGPGDVLYVREACRGVTIDAATAQRFPELAGKPGVLYIADGQFVPVPTEKAAIERWTDLHTYGKKRGHSGQRGRVVPPKYAPRWTSRITLRLTEVRAERLHDISEQDACDEGCGTLGRDIGRRSPYDSAVRRYAALWERIHGPGSWQENPWVWVLTFDVHLVNVDAWLAAHRSA